MKQITKKDMIYPGGCSEIAFRLAKAHPPGPLSGGTKEGHMDYQTIINGMKRFGSTETEICVRGLGLLPEQIHEHVILAPWWDPSVLSGLGEAVRLSEPDASVQIWDIQSKDGVLTFIKTGMGAPVFMDVVLSLGMTCCKKILFVGSVGALDPAIGIGDIVIPEYSICGDGASRYIASGDLAGKDCWGEKTYPDPGLLQIVKEETEQVCHQHEIRWHLGKNISIDTISAQFAHIDTIVKLGCNVVEMETSVGFRAAKMAGISMAAVFSVSDNTMKNKSLVSGRTQEEKNYRAFVRRTAFPEIILRSFQRAF